jgi:hypothetical protein
MAISKTVEDSLKEAEASLRNALAFAARQERPLVCTTLSKLIFEIEGLRATDDILDRLDSRKRGDSGSFGMFFNK